MSNNSENETRRPATKSLRKSMPTTSGILGVVFGIFMFIVYEGMGVLLFINFFDWSSGWDAPRWIVGVILVIYGFFRAYRTYKDIKSHGNTDYDE